MKKLVFAVVLSSVLFSSTHGQTRAPPPPPAGANLNQSVADRSRDLSRLFNDIWQDKLKHQPEYATYLGDKRYDAELTDYSPRAVNEALAHGRTFIERLSKIDTTGLPQ